MFKIGEFSRLAQVSCRLLRHYDDLGLLRPAHTDDASGYRYYSAAQLARLNRILVLRDLGFSLEQIGPMVDDELDAEQLRGMLTLRRAQVERELEQQLTRLRGLETRIAQLAEGADNADATDVRMRSVPACRVLAARLQLPSFDQARAFVGALALEAPGRIGRGRAEALIAVQHAAEYEPDALDLEIGVILSSSSNTPASLEIAGRTLVARELPAIEQAASCVRVGPPEDAHRQGGAIARQIEASGFALDGPNRELFLEWPAPGRPPVIEMQFPVRARTRSD